MADEKPDRVNVERYISVTQAIKLIPRLFKGSSRQLREFIESAEAAIESTHPEKHELVLKLIIAKIQGDVKDELLIKVEKNTWTQVKGILEENYLVKRILEHYTGTLFNSRQGPRGTVVQWRDRLDTVTKDLTRS
jgi:hypothetical protein